MANVAIIPARKGSKSIINKNLVKLDGKETITDKAIRMANLSKIFRKVYLTTDIPYFIENPTNLAEVRKRHKRLCEDESLMEEVILDVIEHYSLRDKDWIWLLQPTSPFRKVKHFKDIERIINGVKSPKTLMSVQNVGPFHPNRMYTRKNNNMYRLRNTNFLNKQELPDVYIRNGAFYVTQVETFLKYKFECKPIYGYIMEDYESVNIDGKFELMLAKHIEEKRIG